MDKCHCSGIQFDKIIEICKSESKDYRKVAKSLDISETCTACKEDMVAYCEKKLGLQVAG